MIDEGGPANGRALKGAAPANGWTPAADLLTKSSARGLGSPPARRARCQPERQEVKYASLLSLRTVTLLLYPLLAMPSIGDLLTLSFLPGWAKGALVVLLAFNIR